jgi:spermidine synthase
MDDPFAENGAILPSFGVHPWKREGDKAMGLFASWRRRREVRSGAGVEVSERDGIRYLHLGTDTVQSAMRIADPDELVLSYTRSMLAFLLFAPRPRRLVNVGLGGGTLARWLHRRLPFAQQVVLELNPLVIACARQYFHLPADDERLVVLEADGARWIAEHSGSADVLLLDGYTGRSQAVEFTGLEFYRHAAAALTARGLLVVNLWSSDRRFDAHLRSIGTVFDGRICCVPAQQKGNVIAIAFHSRPAPVRWDELNLRAQRLQQAYDIEFPSFVSAMKKLNAHTQSGLAI